jgi:hypothetical protein
MASYPPGTMRLMLGMELNSMALRRGVGLSLAPGCQIGYVMDRTGCHRTTYWLSSVGPEFLTIRPTRVVTPARQVGYRDHTGCRQLAF